MKYSKLRVIALKLVPSLKYIPQIWRSALAVPAAVAVGPWLAWVPQASPEKDADLQGVSAAGPGHQWFPLWDRKNHVRILTLWHGCYTYNVLRQLYKYTVLNMLIKDHTVTATGSPWDLNLAKLMKNKIKNYNRLNDGQECKVYKA